MQIGVSVWPMALSAYAFTQKPIRPMTVQSIPDWILRYGEYALAQDLDHLNLAAHPAFAVDHLPALFGAHACSKTDFACAFDSA
jgi:hypothetical protein